MIERVIKPITDKVDLFEFCLRFWTTPNSKDAQAKVDQRLIYIADKYSLEANNMYVLLAKKYKFNVTQQK